MGSLRMKDEWKKGREWLGGEGMEEEREGRRGKREFPSPSNISIPEDVL